MEPRDRHHAQRRTAHAARSHVSHQRRPTRIPSVFHHSRPLTPSPAPRRSGLARHTTRVTTGVVPSIADLGCRRGRIGRAGVITSIRPNWPRRLVRLALGAALAVRHAADAPQHGDQIVGVAERGDLAGGDDLRLSGQTAARPRRGQQSDQDRNGHGHTVTRHRLANVQWRTIGTKITGRTEAGRIVRGRERRILIARPRVRARLEAAPIALLEAPGGYGKSTAATELAAVLDLPAIRVILREPTPTPGVLAALAVACRRAGLPWLAEIVDGDGPLETIARFTDQLVAHERRVLLAVDEVHRASPSAASWLAALADALPEGSRMVIAGRRLGPALAALSDRMDAVVLGVDTLRFDRDEIAATIAEARGHTPDPSEIDAVQDMTQGWPAAVILAAAGGDGLRDHPIAAGRSTQTVLRSLVDDLMDAADPSLRELVAAIVDLPLLSAAVLTVVGGRGALDRLLDAGLPIRFRPDGWGELPGPVRELFPPSPLPADQAREVARIYARRGELAEAVALLHRTGDPTGVVTVLAEQRRDGLVAGGLDALDAALAGIPDTELGREPLLLVRLVQAAERQSRLRQTWTNRAIRVLPDGSAGRRAVDTERALDTAREGDLDGAIGMAEAVLANAGSDEDATRGRAHYVRALSRLVGDTAGMATGVAEELEAAIGILGVAGERGWEAEAYQALGFGCHFTIGAFALAADRLERALALRPAPDAARAGTLTFLAEVQTHLGRFEDAVVSIREAAAIGRRLGDSRTIAYAAWSAAELACQRRDGAAMLAALEVAEAHPGGWFDQLAGVEYLANAAEMHALVGDEVSARRTIALAEARAAGSAVEDAPLAARVRIEVTYGEPTLALELIERLDRSPLSVRRDRWLGLLFRAVCAARLGDTPAAAALVARSRQAAAELGDAERLERREPELLAVAAPDACRGPNPAAMMVVLLGRFAVERDGIDVSPPPGRPSTLVKMLALAGTLTAEGAIDELWPEADLEVGRARLRNLLSRVRAACGDLVARHGAALTLAPGVRVDADRFEREAAAALAAPREARTGLARAALAWSTGELLPADPYADWASVPRERIRRRALALLDLVAEDAIDRGDLDEAARLLDAAITTDPMEEERHVRLARALLAQGRTRHARRVADQALAVCAELGVEPGRELEILLASLARQG